MYSVPDPLSGRLGSSACSRTTTTTKKKKQTNNKAESLCARFRYTMLYIVETKLYLVVRDSIV